MAGGNACSTKTKRPRSSSNQGVRDERDLAEWMQGGPTLILVSTMFRSLALLAILCATASAQTDPSKVRVAIIPGVAVNIGPTRVDALTQDLADALDNELLV